MNKLFTKIASLTLGLALAAGAGAFLGSRAVKSAVATDASLTLSTLSWGSDTQNAKGSANAQAIDSNTSFYFDATDGNTGKYYSTSPKGARMYSSGSAGIVVQAATGYELTSVTFTYAIKNGGLLHNVSKATNVSNPTYPSGTAVALANVQNVEAYIACSATDSSYQVGIQTIAVSYVASGSTKTMTVEEEYGHTAPYTMTFGDNSTGLVFFAKENGSKISGVTWSVSDSSILIMDDDFEDNRVYLKPGQPGEATLTATKSGYTTVNTTVTVVKGGLEQISLSGDLNKTEYVLGSSWNPNGLGVNAIYDSGYIEDVTDAAEFTYSPATASSVSTTSVSITASYGGESTNVSKSVTVINGAAYELTRDFDTYASSWGSYASKSLSGTDVSAVQEASISFTYVSKQSATITNMPVVAAKGGQESSMLFVLDSAVAEDYTITKVQIEFVQWAASKQVAAALYKGTTASGDSLDSFADTDAPRVLETSNLNGDSFTVDFTTTLAASKGNQQLGVKAIYIALEAKATYGTTDHIKVTALPRTIYHVGERFDATGLQVTAYDNSDESIANYKDVTSEVKTQYRSGDYVFDDSNVPGGDMWIEYTDENSNHFYDDLTLKVFALAEYELVTSEPTDWSGSYLLVSSYTDSEEVEHTVAINSALTSFDQPLNFVEVTENAGVIETGQECEFVASSYSDGYSLQGKNSKYAYGSSAGRFQTSDSAQKLSFAFGSDNIVTVTGATSYNLKLNTTSAGSERFGFYKDGVSNIKLYKLAESSQADAYAQTFLGAFTCDSTGETAPEFTIKEGETYWSWSLLADEYDELSAADKETFRLGAGSSAPSASNVAKAIARYDYVVAKYGYDNFMSRTVAPLRNIGSQSIGSNTSNTAIIVVSVIAIVSVSSIGVLLVLKRRKNHI